MEVLFQDGESELIIIKNFLEWDLKSLREYLSTIELEEKPIIKVYGKKCHQRRDVSFFSDESKGYYYSNNFAVAKAMPLKLKSIMLKVNEELGVDFNGILMNRYNSGEDYISAHSDDEKTLGEGGVVASICYGVERNFRIRDKSTKKVVYEVPTIENALIVMRGKFQERYTHEIPISKKIKGVRWSLTFRRHKS